MGIGYSPRSRFDAELANRQLRVLLPDWPAPDLPIHLASPVQRRHSAKVRAFGDAVAQALA